MSGIPLTLPDGSNLPIGASGTDNYGMGAPDYSGAAPSWLSGILGLGSGALSGIFGNRPQKSQTDTTFNSSSTGQSSMRPVLSPQQQGFETDLLNQARRNLYQDPNLKGYEAQGMGNINQAQSAKDAMLRQTLGARGLTYSPLAGAEELNNKNEAFGQKVDLANSLPLLKQQLFQQRLQNATNTFRAMPYGMSGNTSGTQTGNEQQSKVQSGNQTGGGIMGGLGGILGGIGQGILGAFGL